MALSVDLFIIFFGGALAIVVAAGQFAEKKKTVPGFIFALSLLNISLWQFYHGGILSGIVYQ